jgi:hypothetical protein
MFSNQQNPCNIRANYFTIQGFDFGPASLIYPFARENENTQKYVLKILPICLQLGGHYLMVWENITRFSVFSEWRSPV